MVRDYVRITRLFSLGEFSDLFLINIIEKGARDKDH